MVDPAPIHLCGSIPLADTNSVFEAVTNRLGNSVRRIPDGETGNRLSWLGWQDHVFQNDPNFDAIASEGDYRFATTPKWMRNTIWFKLRDGVDPSTIEIRQLEYARHAIASYAIFKAKKEVGLINAGTRFMAAIPTPFNIINSAIAPDDRIRLEPRFEARAFAEINEIADAIPHNQLAIQWDCAHDMQAFDGARKPYFDDAESGLIERWIRVGNAVPATVQMGYHLCYGSLGGKHFVEPKDMYKMVEAVNGFSAGIGRTIEFVHMPVPVERDDGEYFEALKNLKLRPETELYLGLIHDTDGLEGTQRRIAAANKYCTRYGVATECGFGRRDIKTVLPLLDLHAKVAATR